MKDKQRIQRCGFTMIELMAVLIIISLLFGIVAKNVMSHIDQAKVTSTKASLKVLSSAVQQFKMDQGRYPDESVGLQELVEKPSDAQTWPEGGYLETTQVPLDGWKHEFKYERFPENGKPFVIISYGADGQEGGEGENADLYSTDAN